MNVHRWALVLKNLDETTSVAQGEDGDPEQALIAMLEDLTTTEWYHDTDRFMREMVVGTIAQFVSKDSYDRVVDATGLRLEKIQELEECQFYRGGVCPLCQSTVGMDIPTEVPKFMPQDGVEVQIRVEAEDHEGSHMPEMKHPEFEVV